MCLICNGQSESDNSEREQESDSIEPLIRRELTLEGFEQRSSMV